MRQVVGVVFGASAFLDAAGGALGQEQSTPLSLPEITVFGEKFETPLARTGASVRVFDQ